MDKSQLSAFCHFAIGEKVIGGQVAGDEITTPHSPELKAFVVARLGDLMPGYPYYLVPANRAAHQHAEWAPKAKAFADLLREVADGIDPRARVQVTDAMVEAAARSMCFSTGPSECRDTKHCGSESGCGGWTEFAETMRNALEDAMATLPTGLAP